MSTLQLATNSNHNGSGHVPTQSEQFFGGFALQISIDHHRKLVNWICTKCGCENKGKAKTCGLCGTLNPKYIVKPENAHKQTLVKKQRSKLLSSRDIFYKLTKHFPHWKKYKQIKTKSANKSSKRTKSKKNVIEQLSFEFPTFPLIDIPFESVQSSPVHTQSNIITNDLFDHNHLSGPYGLIPTIISDEDDDLPLGALGDNEEDDDDDDDGHIVGNFAHLMDIDDDGIDIEDDEEDDDDIFNVFSLQQRLDSNQSKYEQQQQISTPRNQLTPRHARQQSYSAPSTPPGRAIKYTVKINRKQRPLLIGVIHIPAPSKRNRVDIVMKNIENIVKFEFDGCFFINHGYSANHIVSIIKDVHRKYPSLWLGANFMGIAEKKIFKFVKTHKLHKILKGVWCEESGIALDPEELDKIFVHNFYNDHNRDRNQRFRKDTQELINMSMVHDVKEDEVDDAQIPITGLSEHVSNLSAMSSGSTKSIKSNGSQNGGKKRVTFSDIANSLIDENINSNNSNNSNHGTPKNGTPKNGTPKNGTPKSKTARHKKTCSTSSQKASQSTKTYKKDDSFARARLQRIEKYKFKGLYFGGVDLKSSNIIKVPTQKSVRTRRRTYSTEPTAAAAEANKAKKPSSVRSRGRTPRSNSAHSRSKSRTRSKATTSKDSRKAIKKSKSSRNIRFGMGTPTKSRRGNSPKKGSKSPRKKRAKLRKSSSNNKYRKIRSSSHALHRSNTPKSINTIQREAMKRSKTERKDQDKDKDQKSNKKKKNKFKKQDLIKIDPSSSKLISAGSKDDVLATISSGDDEKNAAKIKSKANKQRFKYVITPKWKRNLNKNRNKNKSKLKAQSLNSAKRANIGYSMTDTEDNNDAPNSPLSFFSAGSPSIPPLAVARSLEATEVRQKSPSVVSLESPKAYHDDTPSPSPGPYAITTNNIKMHNLHMHRPMNSNHSDHKEDENIFNGNNSGEYGGDNRVSWIAPISMTASPHTIQPSQDSQVSSSHSRDSVYSNNSNDDIGSVYSHASQLSEAWSEYGSVTETLDDYFEALNKLGRFASDGYMHVITTSGKGRNIDIKLKALNEACNKKCLLAVASGVRIENLELFLPHVDILMVSTCISHDFHLYDPKKMAKFKRTVDTYFHKL